jgi:hypothetical protein
MRGSNGYGLQWSNARKQPVGVHVIFWEHSHGPVPKGKMVCHRCDVKHCYRLSHLFLGTHQDNMTDGVLKGRFRRGENHSAAKLNDVAVRVIRYFLARGMPQGRLAQAYKVHVRVISAINVRHTWKHVA